MLRSVFWVRTAVQPRVSGNDVGQDEFDVCVGCGDVLILVRYALRNVRVSTTRQTLARHRHDDFFQLCVSSLFLSQNSICMCHFLFFLFLNFFFIFSIFLIFLNFLIFLIFLNFYHFPHFFAFSFYFFSTFFLVFFFFDFSIFCTMCISFPPPDPLRKDPLPQTPSSAGPPSARPPKMSLYVFPLPPPFSLSFSLFGGLFVEFWWCF